VPKHYEQTEDFNAFFVPWFVYEFVADPHDPESVANAPAESLDSTSAVSVTSCRGSNDRFSRPRRRVR
jgi:hypothetical protein